MRWNIVKYVSLSLIIAVAVGISITGKKPFEFIKSDNDFPQNQPDFTSVMSIPKQVPETQAQLKFSFASVVKQAKPAVVSISSIQVAERRLQNPLFDDQFFNFLFGNGSLEGVPRQQIEKSLGSGVIIDPQGIIITCQHVVHNAKKIQVKLDDNRLFDADVIVIDAKSDLAVIKIKTPKGKDKILFPFVPLGDSKNLEIGDLVLAIGNPFGVGMTVTNGIVSALSRSFNGQILMQTDAAINPGNSGGALVDMHGHLIGVPNAILSRTGASHGIGFAIPAVVIRSLLLAAKGDGKVVYPWDGLQLKSMTNEEAESFGFEKPMGILVVAVHPNSPAAKAGLKSGDIITKVNDHLLQAVEDYQVALQGLQINESLNVTMFRKNKEEKIVFTLIAPPVSEDPEIQILAAQGPFAGVKVANMSPALAAEYNLMNFYREGVIVIEAPQPLFGIGFSGLQPGDIIEEVNNQKITSVKQLLREMKGNMHRMAVRRGQGIFVLQAH